VSPELAEQQVGVALGIDIGGTFTDLVLLDAVGSAFVHKVPTTPDAPADGALRGLRELLARRGLEAARISVLVHSTTLVTNSLIERKGTPTALLCTRGFRDVLDMRREQRYDLYDVFLTWPEPLVQRDLRFGISERMTRDGSPLAAPSRENVDQAVRTAIERGVGAIAVAFLHSYANPEHEREVARLILATHPQLHVVLSSDVAPVLGEFERTLTAVAEAYIAGTTVEYLRGLADGLQSLGFRGQVYLMLSNGGAATLPAAIAHPIRLVESGPAAGAAAAAQYGRAAGQDPVLSFDMGGTTAKVCLIEDGAPAVVNQVEVARVHRLRRGSGMPLLVPSVELLEIGAGGGSLAEVSPAGVLRVGPESAGAVPGPACYGRGGTRPTVTDANLVLGYLGAASFLGGEMPLNSDAARAALTPVAQSLGLSIERTAWAVHDVANETMAAAARMHLVERNWDPRRVAVVAFGGAGPAHALAIARKLGARRVLFPPGAGATSALGSLVAPLAFQYTRSLPGRLSNLDWAHVNCLLAELESEGRGELLAAGVRAPEVELIREADLRMFGQASEVGVPIPGGTLDASSVAQIRAAFGRVYRRLYNRHTSEAELEVVSWRLIARGPRRQLPTRRARPAGDSLKCHRPVYVPELRDFAMAPVYDRYCLEEGSALVGPAIIEEREATTVLPAATVATVDADYNLVADALASGA
jgi:N-methylhydantoinase A/oxoprolinase/acetone carboxylase beta subunit